MCGRYTLVSNPEAIRALFRYVGQPNFPPRYNIAPTQPIAVVRLSEGRREFALLRWGLIPGWVKDPRAFSLLFNARGESVLRKAGFPAGNALSPLPDPVRRLLRMEADRTAQAAALCPCARRRTDGLCRPVGKLDGPERRGDGNRRHRHHRGEPSSSRRCTIACRSFCRRRPSIFGSIIARSMRKRRLR